MIEHVQLFSDRLPLSKKTTFNHQYIYTIQYLKKHNEWCTSYIQLFLPFWWSSDWWATSYLAQVKCCLWRRWHSTPQHLTCIHQTFKIFFEDVWRNQDFIRDFMRGTTIRGSAFLHGEMSLWQRQLLCGLCFCDTFLYFYLCIYFYMCPFFCMYVIICI